ncbi:MAG TPA: carboxylesterase family protein [Gammaproteobacteria bacterium]|nr:carboxylesterase family protein [Gammaproteobacteria bacterium]
MKAKGGIVLGLIVVLSVLVGAAVLVHLHAPQPLLERLHDAVHRGTGHGALPGSEAGAESRAREGVAAMSRAREGVAAIGSRWDAEAFAATVALYTAVHRELEWPGVLEPETVRYGDHEQQTFELFRPEQGFSEPGPVFVFLHGNGLGNSDRSAPGSDGFIYDHLGKLAATFGGIGVSMSYRNGAGTAVESGAEDLRLVIGWIVEHIAPYGGDPGTIVVLGNSEGATRTAAYLFDEDLQMASGPGIAAAILSSGLFGSLAPGIEELVRAYDGERVPLALWSAGYDTAEVSSGIADLHELLCRKYDGCPWFEQIEGHNHVSHVLSLGTDDTDVQNRLIRFYHTVR